MPFTKYRWRSSLYKIAEMAKRKEVQRYLKLLLKKIKVQHLEGSNVPWNLKESIIFLKTLHHLMCVENSPTLMLRWSCLLVKQMFTHNNLDVTVLVHPKKCLAPDRIYRQSFLVYNANPSLCINDTANHKDKAYRARPLVTNFLGFSFRQ